MMTTQEIKPMEQPKMSTNQLQVMRTELDAMSGEFDRAIPRLRGGDEQMFSADQFTRWLINAIQANPRLAECTRHSFYQAAMRAAQDGLRPDNNECAIVPFKNNRTGNVEAQYFSMVGGLRKLVMESGKVKDWIVHAVGANDAFDWQLGSEPFIAHKPALSNRGPVVAVYSIANFVNGGQSIDVMVAEEIAEIKALSKGKNTPWNVAAFYGEMAKKTVARRHSKQLPRSSDFLVGVFAREDADFVNNIRRDSAGIDDTLRAQVPQNLTARLEELADDEAEVGTNGTEETDEGRTTKAKDKPNDVAQKDDAGKGGKGEKEQNEAGAHSEGVAAQRRGMARKAVPGAYRSAEQKHLADAWLAGWDEAEAAEVEADD